MAYSDSILTLTHDFLVYLVPQLSKFPRDHKFTLGDRVQKQVHDILDEFVTAYYTKAGPGKLERLQNANVKLELLRYAVRACHDLKLLNNEKYGVISRKINEIGGTLGNWIKTLEGKNKI